MNTNKHIVILGGGYGGILTAKRLAKHYRKESHIKITLIDKKPYHTMLTELHEVAAGRIPEDGIRINFNKVFAGRNVDVILDEIENIDFDKQLVSGKTTCTKYDYLVIGTGSKPTFFNNIGAEKHAFTLWSYEDAIKIKHHMWEVFGKASVETDLEKRRRLLTFVVIGCGFTGIEMIGELAEWRESLCHTFNIPEIEIRLIVADMIPEVLPGFHEKLVNKTIKRLNKMRVEIKLNSRVTDVQPEYIEIEDSGKIDSNTVIWTAGIEGSDIVQSFDGNEIEKVARHRIETDDYLRTKKYKNVFVVGDNIHYIPEGEEKPVPQMVENAEHSSATVTKNITASINKQELKKYMPKFHGAMVSIGGRYGVAQINTSKKQHILSGFFAMLLKHFINFIYFVKIAGFQKLWSYWMHEFFHVENRRSFLGGHFSKRSPNFWLVPFRLLLGGMWLSQGLDKLFKIIKNPTEVFLLASKIPVTGATEVVDTAEIAEWGEALPVPEFISSIVDWSMELLFYTSTGDFTFMAVFFQTALVLAEIVVGLCLIGGLFTALSSIISVLMCLLIWASGMAPYEMLWYIFGGIAMIGGSGSTFGLDYYILPYLGKKWRNIKFVKKWYLYTD